MPWSKVPTIENDHPTFAKKSLLKKNIYIYINRYDWVDDHSLSQGNIRRLDQRVDLASDLWTCELNRLHK